MEILLSKRNPVGKKRESFSLRFGSQKPTFAISHEEPTRYYDFVDTPILFKPPSPLISRQEVDPELESKVRCACSLLVYRIEQGVPSPPTQPSRRPDITREGPTEDNLTTAQLDCKYLSPKVDPETAALKSKYDSGVGLTQQPSMQTMRASDSHSGAQSESEDNASLSVFSERRTSTSCSNTTSIGNTTTTEQSCIASAVQTPQQNEMQSMTRSNIIGSPQPQDDGTMAFLKSSSKQTFDDSYDESEGVEVFLDPDALVDSNWNPGSHSHPQSNNTSPSLGITRETVSKYQSTMGDSPPELTQSTQNSVLLGLGTSALEENANSQANVIIDSNGCAHFLTAEEEIQRKLDLQQAVIAKMKAGPISNAEPDISGEKTKLHPGMNKTPPRSETAEPCWPSSREIKTIPTVATKRKSGPQDTSIHSHLENNNTTYSVFKRMTNFFLTNRK